MDLEARLGLSSLLSRRERRPGTWAGAGEPVRSSPSSTSTVCDIERITFYIWDRG